MKLQIADCRLQIGVAAAVATIALVGWLATGSVAAANEIIDRVMAVVSGDLILMSDVRAARELGMIPNLVDPASGGQAANGGTARTAGTAGTEATADDVVLKLLIDRSLVLAEVERYAPPEPTAQAVDAEFARVRDRIGSTARLDAVLSRVGLDENHLRQLLREDLRIRAYLDQRFASDDAARRNVAIDEWITGLRRRADIVQP